MVLIYTENEEELLVTTEEDNLEKHRNRVGSYPLPLPSKTNQE